MKFRNIAALLALSATLAACVSGDDSTPADSKPTAGFQAQFNPTLGILPFPNDLYSGTNGQLAIPGDAKVAANGPLLELNHLDGYGTQSDISVYFTSSIDKSSINKSDVIVLKVTSETSAQANPKLVVPTGAATLLTQDADYNVGVSPATDVNGMVLTIKPLKPLAPSTVDPVTHTATFSTYMVIITNGLKDTDGNAVTPSATFSKVVSADAPLLAGGKFVSTGDATLDAAAQFTAPQLALAAALKIPLKDVAVTFSFSTEFLHVALDAIAANAAPTAQPLGTGIFFTTKTAFDMLSAAGETLTGTAATNAKMADIYAGDVALPYYLTVPSKSNPTAALTDSWHNANGTDVALSATDPASFLAKATVAQNVIPILVSIPNAHSPCAGTMPGSGWQVVVFQHGITRNREDMLAVAGTYAAACFAVVAIDLPLHGVTDKTDPFYKNQLFAGSAAAAALTAPVSERTFDMDLEDNSSGAAGADGTIDGSGAWFINLSSTITSRDNLREGAADLINLVATLPTLQTHGATTGSFDSSQVYFLGHSLGGIIGTTFLGVDSEIAAATLTSPHIKAATLAMPGGHIAELLIDSPTFGPQINQGLAAQGLAAGTQEYFDFLNEAQAVVEDGDPANYAADAAAGHPIHMIEVVGNGGSNLPDQVVPNSATQVLIDAMALDKITATTVNPTGVHGVVQFTAGNHGSILDPTASAAATTEMQTEALIFAAGFPTLSIPGGGEAIVINDTSVVKH